ncbi:MAG: DNA-directed RNA polymerase subunit beta [candidate division Zixibacteria bacterium]|nr:DNA-directed RNA polymerase subunit beta [candidate division Zixibacteria bacterium]
MSSNNGTERVSFSKLETVLDLPHLLAVQTQSFNEFLQARIVPEKRRDQGLQTVFQSIFPITDVRETRSLEFVSYSVDEPRYSIVECQERNMSYGAPLKATLRLITRETEDNDDSESAKVKDIIEQDVFLGELPLMTEKGTFIINGAERVIVSQLHRSPGVFFDETIHPNGKKLFSTRIIPYRGSWVEFTLDVNDIMYVHIDSRRKLTATTLLRAIGYSSDEDLIGAFCRVKEESFSSRKVPKLIDRYTAAPIVDPSTGEVIIEAGEKLSEADATKLIELKISKVKLVDIDLSREVPVIINTITKDKKDKIRSEEDALQRLYSLIRPGDAPTSELAKSLLDKMFFNPKRYDLGEVGRYMINQRLNLDIPVEQTVLDKKDFICIVEYLIDLRNGKGDVDDIDHLGNRRSRSVGELLGNQFSVGLSRMARTIKERMSLRSDEAPTPHELINARTVSSVIDAFFGSSQLSQFMDQTNPLAELTHKRRLSALGPGGLTRERAGFKVRDVHHTHYGRMCPIETPEGPNIGLITSLASYARINKYGFLETPYRKVIKGKVTTEIEYLTADVEDRYLVAQANESLEKNGKFTHEIVTARNRGDLMPVDPVKIAYMDVAPMQLVSVAASLIPFLEHDDANRALMGSNMQRQAVPLLETDSPVVGTGIEGTAAIDSYAVVTAKRAGTVEFVASDQIVIKPTLYGQSKALDIGELDEYHLIKYARSNQDTCISQKPIVKAGEKIAAGQSIADGAATDNGELALGKNVMVGFMVWRGYNFEDAIIVSDRMITDDVFTSIHIEEFEIQVRDTKRGAEEITREIPNVSEEALVNLDEAGIVRIGAEIEAGDILVGKVTPKGETELSPEERLLRAIFGEKAGDVRDASLKAPPGMRGIVIDTKLFSRKKRSEEAKKQERNEIARLKKNFSMQIDYILDLRNNKLAEILNGQTAQSIRGDNGEIVVKPGTKINDDSFAHCKSHYLITDKGFVADEKLSHQASKLCYQAKELIIRKQTQQEIEIEKVVRGTELPPGVVQLVKVKIATKRQLSVGDKMAGRHGNKGVIAKIVPAEDMPYLPDGRPLDILLNPLGVPSRMNVGQLLETHLGWAAQEMGLKIATPVFDGASEAEIKDYLKKAGLPKTGKSVVYDGLTGEPFNKEITVGCIYMMKLSHLVDDKIHARSIGPYSLVTQQPLGGKAQFGGQRFGEMEVWALEAYGAAHILQEMLTVKSDDVSGRSRIYEAIVKGENPPEPGVPESFNVLVKELQSLGLDVELIEK